MNIELNIDGKKVECEEVKYISINMNDGTSQIYYPKEKKNPLRAHKGWEYFRLTETGGLIFSEIEKNYSDDDARYNSGNYFLTFEAAEQELKKREALVRIKEYIAINFGEWKPDWSDGNTSKYLIAFNYLSKQFEPNYISSHVRAETPFGYFTKKHAAQLIKDCENDLRIIFGV